LSHLFVTALEEGIDLQVFLMRALSCVFVEMLNLQEDALTKAIKRDRMQLSQHLPIGFFNVAHH